MKKCVILLFCILFTLATTLKAQENRVPIIIDTDLGLDDSRALTLFLSTKGVDIKAIITSDGSSSPKAGYENILRILRYLKKPLVPIGMGRTFGAPPWREKCDTLGWAIWPDSIDSHSTIPSSTDIILKILNDTYVPIVYICMGPLTNLAEALRNKNFPKERIEKVLYYGSSPSNSEQSWNTNRDLKAARFVFSSPLPIWVFNPAASQLIPFDSGFYNTIKRINTDAAQLIALTHKDKRVQILFGTKHSMIWDEILALYLNRPSLIMGEFLKNGNPVFRFKNWDKDEAKQLYIEMLGQGLQK